MFHLKPIVCPPSTLIEEPFINFALSEHKNKTNEATSFGSPNFFNGTFLSIISFTSLAFFFSLDSHILPLKKIFPGLTTFTRTWESIFLERPLARVTKLLLAVEYANGAPNSSIPAIEEIKTIEPLDFFIRGKKILSEFKADVKFIFQEDSHLIGSSISLEPIDPSPTFNTK